MADTVIFLLSGTTTWNVPSDWNDSANSVVCIGAGAGGPGGSSLFGGDTGGGAGGGGWSRSVNITAANLGGVGNAVPVRIGAGGPGGISAPDLAGSVGTAGGDTWFNASSLANAATQGVTKACGAQGGQVSVTVTGGAGGAAANGTGTTKASGGKGGDSTAGAPGAAGGGGAGGPRGDGGAGGPVSAGSHGGAGGGGSGGGASGTVGAPGLDPGGTGGGAGGNNAAGAGGGGAVAADTNANPGTVGGGGSGGGANGTGTPRTGGVGGPGADYTSNPGGTTSGPGGGAGAGGIGVTTNVAGNGGVGGNYGGGGGGGATPTGAGGFGVGGAGANGLIVITYTPGTPTPPSSTTGTSAGGLTEGGRFTPRSGTAYPPALRATSGLTSTGTASTPPAPAPPSGGYPGQIGNPVGFAAAPNYPGSLTTHAPSGFASNTTYSFLDIDTGTGNSVGMSLAGLNNVTFIGCRFQSNNTSGVTVSIAGGTNITFSYCSFVPRVSDYTLPPGAAWPSAGGINVSTFIPNVNCIDGTKGFNFGLYIPSGGPVTVRHCECWGFGNGFCQIDTTTAAMLFDSNWIHDARDGAVNSDHTDGIGYLNAAAACSNVTVSNNTIASIGNTNAIAFQQTSTSYANMTVTGNYLSGYAFTADPYHTGPATNCVFTDNIFATDLQWFWGPIYADPTTLFTGSTNVWRRNTFVYIAGSVVRPGSGGMAFSSADNGKFIWPNSTLHATDFTG